MRPRDNAEALVRSPRVFHNATRRLRVAQRHNEEDRAIEVGPLEHESVAGVAVDRGSTGVAQRLHEPAVLFDNEHLHVSPLQRTGDERPHAAVPRDHRVPLQLLSAVAFQMGEGAGAAIVEAADYRYVAQAFGERLDRPEEKRIQGDRDDRRGDDEVMGLRGKNAELTVELGEHERELADLGEPRADDECGPDRIAKGQDDSRRDEPLAHHDQRDHGRDEQRLAHDKCRIEQHADRNEEQHREGIAQRQRFGGGLVTQIRFADRDACEERPERERDLECEGRDHGHTKRDDEDGEREELAMTRARDLREKPWDHARADGQHEDAEQPNFRECDEEPERQVARVGSSTPTEDRREWRKEDEHDDDREVLDHHPAHRDLPVRGFEEPDIGERSDEHHRARYRDREAEHDSLGVRPAPQRDDECGHRGRDHDLPYRARHRDPADGPQIGEREMDADAEHQEDHPDLGELVRDRRIRGEARREGADGNPGGEVAHKRRKPQPCGDEAAKERRAQRDRDRQDQAVRRHRPRSSRSGIGRAKRA